MPNTRLAALSLLLSLSALPACGPEKLEDEAMEETDGGSSGGSSGDSSGDSSGGSSGGSSGAADVSREGEACDENGSNGPCTVDGVEGLEFCVYDANTMGKLWSACQVDGCTELNATRPCEGGVQYCFPKWVESDQLPTWGVCTGGGECTPGQTADCGFEDMQVSTSCIYDENGVPIWDPFGCSTPLVLSFGEEVAFVPAAASAADFDIHGGPGVCVRADWPSAVTPWLALDLDKNGSIDGGHELFGSGTRLAAGTGSPNGFVALAQLDSDGDGKISAGDARFGELVLWADHDGDRRSSGWEMLPLASFEIVEIELAYASRRQCDAAGNCGVERASFVYRQGGRERVGEVVDVHLACE